MRIHDRRLRCILFFVIGLFACAHAFAGVSRAIQDRYRRDYDNKALFLKMPVYADKATVFITGRTFRQETNSGPARFKVGDQLRVIGIDFGGDEIKFKLSQIAPATGLTEIVFKFDSNLLENFPNSDVFDKALQATFTEGLKYTDLEDARHGFVEDQFDRNIKDVAETSGTSRDAVLKAIAPRIPLYQDALKDIDNLKNRNQDLAGQLAQTQSDNRKLEAELRTRVNEVNQLRKDMAALQEKIDTSSNQLNKLGEEVRRAQGYQKELANIQRSFNIKVDNNRDLAAQIVDLGLVLQKLHKDNANLESQSESLKQNLETQQIVNTRLTGENDDLKNSNRQMKETITALTSKEDSLARQFLEVKQNRDNLQNLALAFQNLSARLVHEKAEASQYSGTYNICLRNILLGTLNWTVPTTLSRGQQKASEAVFASESIDYVKLTPDERFILRSLGDRLKLQLKLVAGDSGLVLAPEQKEPVQEIGERDRATWKWKITNRGMQDARVFITARLVNKNADEIPLLEEGQAVKSSNAVRQFRQYLQPLPLAAGVVIGFLLFGIVGLFRHKGTDGKIRRHHTDSHTYIGQKKL
jgi:peptidoglycan hydrolase CwlO-like protein